MALSPAGVPSRVCASCRVRACKARAPGRVGLVQADAAKLCFRDAAFDLIWSCNTVNHLSDPVAALVAMRAALRPAGRVVLAQSGFLPEMFFAWDAPLDEAVRRACHQYYRERIVCAPVKKPYVRLVNV